MAALESLVQGIVSNFLTDFLNRKPTVRKVIFVLSVASFSAAVLESIGWAGLPSWVGRTGPFGYLALGSVGLMAVALASLPRPVSAEEWQAQAGRFRELALDGECQFTVYNERPWKDEWRVISKDGASQADLNRFAEECTRAAKLLSRETGYPLTGIGDSLPYQWLWMMSRFSESFLAEHDGVKVRSGFIHGLKEHSAFVCVQLENDPRPVRFLRERLKAQTRYPLAMVRRRFRKMSRFGSLCRFAYSLSRVVRRRSLRHHH